jgi:hypothetical protein
MEASMKTLSRPKRWEAAAAKAALALEELVDIQVEYQEWYDGMPENLQQSATGEMLEEITNLDLESALDSANEAEGTDLPRGFGRD